MKRSRFVVPLVIVFAALSLMLILNIKHNSEKEVSLKVTNLLSDISITALFLDNDTVSGFGDNPLRPGETFQINIPGNSSLLEAVDTSGGIYSSRLTITDSTDSLQIELSMMDRMVFEETIESNGEYWTGSGTGTVRITNSLLERDVYWLHVTPDGEDIESRPDRLGAFILFPGRVLNVRVAPGFYHLSAEDALREEYTCSGAEIDPSGSQYSWEITIGDLSVPVDTAATGGSRFILCNALDDWIITGVYHRNSTEGNWSGNHLDGGGIEPKEQFFLFLDPGVYDIRVEDEDNDTYTRRSLRISPQGSTWNVTMDDLDLFIP